MTGRDPSVAHVLGRLAVIEARIRDAVARRRHTDTDPDDGFRGLYLTDDHVDRLLDRPDTSPPADSTDIAALRDRVERTADAAESAGGRLALRALVRDFGLAPLDVDVLLVTVAPDLDPRFEKLFGYLHDDVSRRRASIGLAIELARASPVDRWARSRFDPTAPAVLGGLLTVEEPERPFLTRALRVPDRVTSHLLGGSEVDPTLYWVRREPHGLVAPEGGQLARALAAGVRVVHCRQPPGSWCPSIAVAALEDLGGTLVIDLSAQPADEAAALLRMALREARLLGRVLVAGPVEHLDQSALRQATSGDCRVVLYGAGSWNPAWAASGVLGLDLHELSRRRTPQPWPAALADGSDGDQLAAFRLSPDQVVRAVQAARSQAAAVGDDAPERHLSAGARMQNAAELGRLARRVEPGVGWSDLVLPSVARSGLRHLTDRVRWRSRVLGDWRLRRAGGRGEGVTALFGGDPGTGKTMAAEVVAGDLGLDLYVIDLSTVVDKYVGETEKNLERVFAGAEGVNGVLFFDEADALFGKRSEVSDARDRYANLEVAYLLQRMESFDGLAILATNLRANLDEAFTRRLSMVVEFPTPTLAERRVLWRKALAAVPLGHDVDLEFCASAFELAGGDIRNVAVTAAYLAAADGGIATMRQIIHAVRVEYRKLGRLCVEAEFGPYYPLLSAVP